MVLLLVLLLLMVLLLVFLVDLALDIEFANGPDLNLDLNLDLDLDLDLDLRRVPPFIAFIRWCESSSDFVKSHTSVGFRFNGLAIGAHLGHIP